MADLAKIFDQARALRAAALPTGEIPRGEAAARYAKEHGVSLGEAGRQFGISRERVRQKWRDLFGKRGNPHACCTRGAHAADRRPGATGSDGVRDCQRAWPLANGVTHIRDRLGLALVKGNDKEAVTEETKAKILAMADAGKSRAEIAHETGTSYGSVNKHPRGRGTRGKRATRGASAMASETMDRTGCSLNAAAAMFILSPPALYAYRKRRGLWTVAP